MSVYLRVNRFENSDMQGDRMSSNLTGYVLFLFSASRLCATEKEHFVSQNIQGDQWNAPSAAKPKAKIELNMVIFRSELGA